MSKLRRSFGIVGALGAGLLLAGARPVMAASFTVSTTGGSWQTLYVQGFSPSVAGSSAATALGSGDTVDLSQFQFFKSGNADTAANIQLAIFTTMYPNLSTDMSTTSSNFVGLSTNTILSTAPIATNSPETFTFANLPLVYGNNYGAIFVNVSGTTLTPVLVSALAESYVDDGTGTGNFIPSPNYGGLDNYAYATSNFISGNFFNAFGHAGDATFTATLNTVPEPGTLAITGLAAITLFRRRSR